MISAFFLVDVGHAVIAARIRLKLKAGIASLDALFAASRAGADAGVRCVQLADHLANDIVHLLLIADEVEKRFVGLPHLLPIDAVHVRRIEAVLHDPPTLLKYLASFRTVIHFHTGGKVDAAWAASGS